MPSSASRVECSSTRTTEPLGKTGRTSCGASFAFLASFLGMKVHELFFNQLSFEVDAGLDVFDENVLVPAGTIPQAARF